MDVGELKSPSKSSNGSSILVVGVESGCDTGEGVGSAGGADGALGAIGR